MTFGTEPLRQAMTGVPVAMASIMTRPNGSVRVWCEKVGFKTASAFRRRRFGKQIGWPDRGIMGFDENLYNARRLADSPRPAVAAMRIRVTAMR